MSYAQKQGLSGKKVTASAPTKTTTDFDGEYEYYVVRSGDNLWTIAKKYPGVSNMDIMRANGITEEMLKCGGDVVTKWMVMICQMAWEGGGASRLGKCHHCHSLQREGQERGVWEL